LSDSGRDAHIIQEFSRRFAARNYGDCLPKARRLALGLALAAAPQLYRASDSSAALKMPWSTLNPGV